MKAVLYLLVACVVALLVGSGVSKAAAKLELAVPSRVNVGDTVRIVATGPANTTFDFVLSGPGGFNFFEKNTFDPRGVFDATLPSLDEGDYLISVSITNESVTKQMSVVCGSGCQAQRIQLQLLALDSRYTAWFTLAAVGIVVFEVYRIRELAKDKAEMAHRLGLPVPRIGVRGLIRKIRFILPFSSGSLAIENNPRNAYNEQKMAILGQIHEKTSIEQRPIGREYEYEYGMAQLFKDYVVADKQVVDSMKAQDYDSETEEVDIIDWMPSIVVEQVPEPVVVWNRKLCVLSVILGVGSAPFLLDVLSRFGVYAESVRPVAAAAYAIFGSGFMSFFSSVVAFSVLLSASVGCAALCRGKSHGR